MRNRKRMKVLAGVLTLAMAVSAVPATKSLGYEAKEPMFSLAADTATGTAVTAAPTATGAAATAAPTATGAAATAAPGSESPVEMSVVQKILKENRESLMNLPDKKQVRIDERYLQSDPELAVTFASALAKEAGLDSIKYNVAAKLTPVVLTTLVKQELNIYEVDISVVHEMIAASYTVKKVKVVKMSKKQIVVLQKKGKKITYITFTVKSGKVKKGVTISKTGNKYKKNKKSIPKKKFDKFVKKFNKMKKLPMKEVGAADPDFYNTDASYFYKNDQYWLAKQDYSVSFLHEPTDKTDEYKIYEEDQYDDSTTRVYRYILPPNVAASGSSVTYQQATWEKSVLDYFDLSTDTVVASWNEMENGKYKVKSSTVSTGFDKPVETGKSVKVSRYTLVLEYPKEAQMDTQATKYFEVTIDVFETGANKGKIMSYEYGWEGYEPNCRYVFWYDERANYDGQYMDPLDYAMCYQSGELSAKAPKRSVTINYSGKNPAIKSWTVEADASVKFYFPYAIYNSDKKIWYDPGFSAKINGSDVLLATYIMNEDGTTKSDESEVLDKILNSKEKDGIYKIQEGYENALFWDEANCSMVLD